MKIIKKNTKIKVKHIFGETAEAVTTKLGYLTYQFNCDAYVLDEHCRYEFFHLRQAREVIPGKKIGYNLKFWPRLRRALHEAGLKPVNIPGGGCPIHYEDEVVVPDYSRSGSHYFIIKSADVGKYLDRLPLDDAGKARRAKAMAEAHRQAHNPKRIDDRIK